MNAVTKSTLLTLFLLLFLVVPVEAKRFGPFKKGDRFTMKVTKVKSTRQIGYSGPSEKHRIHRKAARFRVGTTLKFRIKARGKLTAKKISIPFAHGTRRMAEYNVVRGSTILTTRNAEILARRGKAIRGTLSYFIRDDSGTEPVFYTVVYKLK